MELNQVLQSSKEKIIIDLKTTINGLSQDEAQKRLREFGQNILPREKGLSSIKILLHQGQNILFYVLLLAAILSFFLGDKNETYIISTVLIINTFLGFYGENKSVKAVEKLQKMLHHKVICLRNGSEIFVEENFLVPGDVVYLREGDIVPADIRILSAEDLMVNESQLTGESIPLNKVVIESRSPKETLLFSGSTIDKGEASGVVFATGMHTELGRIAQLSEETQKNHSV